MADWRESFLFRLAPALPFSGGYVRRSACAPSRKEGTARWIDYGFVALNINLGHHPDVTPRCSTEKRRTSRDL